MSLLWRSLVHCVNSLQLCAIMPVPVQLFSTKTKYFFKRIFSTPTYGFIFISLLAFLQNETYREEFLNERKEKERVLSLKDKLKRDLENAQSRISSLQEQVGQVGRVILQFKMVRFEYTLLGPVYTNALSIGNAPFLTENASKAPRPNYRFTQRFSRPHYNARIRSKTGAAKGTSEWPFPSCLLPRFQNESRCETIQMKMSLICMKINLQIKLIFIWKVVHQDSFWNREKGNPEMAYYLPVADTVEPLLSGHLLSVSKIL